jgi:hypothetical protein
MNIGIVFSGYLRCFNDTINSLKENLIHNNNNFDIFLHYSKNSLENKYHNEDISIEEVKKQLSIKSIIYTDDLLLSNNPKENNILNQNYKLYILNQHIKTLLKVQNKKYVIIGTMFYRRAQDFIDGLQVNYVDNIRSNNEFYVDDVINQNIKKGLNIKVFEVENYICWGTPDDYETYCYWLHFFNKCNWHPYTIDKDTTS